MSDMKLIEKFEKLDSLLEAERRALLAGELDRLAEMLPEKEALIDALNHVTHDDAKALRRLDGKVRRNQLLLDSAMEGIRTVSRRLSALRRVRNSLETYDSSGRKQRVETDIVSKVEKHA